jgi:nucleotide-binding universal stress UspA family protein
MEATMFQRILVPTDGSDITTKAVDTAIRLARSLGARLYTISVKEPFPYSAISEMQPTPPQEFFDAQERIASRRIQDVRAAAEAAGIPCEAHTVEALHPWEAIIEHAQRQECDLLVMASHGRRGVTALLLGSETQKVLTHSKIPVLVVR